MKVFGTWRSAAALAALSAFLLVFSHPPFDLPLLAWVALIPLFILVRRSGAGAAWAAGHFTGFLFYCGLQWWSLTVEGYNLFNFSFQYFILAGYFGLFGLIANYFHKRIPGWSLVTFPATWVVIEYLRSHAGFLSWPWGTLAYTQYQIIPILKVVAFGGISSLSFLIVLANAAFVEILDRTYSRAGSAEEEARRPAILGRKTLFIALVLALAFMSVFLPGPAENEFAANGGEKEVKVALVQGNMSIKETLPFEVKEKVFRKFEQLTLEAGKSDPHLIVWPSSSVPGMIPYDQGLVRALSGLAGRANAFLLIGSAGYDKFSQEQRREKKVSNSAFLFSPEGRMIGRYDKIRLLPFDEYYPMRGQVRWPAWIVSPQMTDSLAGKELTVFQLRNLRFGVMICWENYFPDLFRELAGRGVDFMVSMTNDSFTRAPAAYYQILAMNVLRAVENGLPVLRVASTGVTAIIEPDGRIAGRVLGPDRRDIGVEGYVTGTLQPHKRLTFYNRHGDLFFAVVFVFLAISAFFAIRGRLPLREEA